jgi:hypothetical protein
MRPCRYLLALALALIAGLGATTPLRAEVVRFRFVPDACGNVTLAPDANGLPGQRSSWYLGPRQSIPTPIPPNVVVTFRHAYTGQNVAVPLALPEDTPRIEHRPAAYVYNYGSYTVQLRFLPDGSVETVYNSGFFRPLRPY